MKVPVLVRDIRSWPHHADAPVIPAMDLADALGQTFDDDAHFVAYAAPHPCKRLAIPALDTMPVLMIAAVFDVDDPEKSTSGEARASWRDEQRVLLRSTVAVLAVVYDTRGGYRMVFELSEPVQLNSRADGERWKLLYDTWCDEWQAKGITVDRHCKDWTRLYRLPFVRRDGVDEKRPIEWPSTEGTWPAPNAATFAAIEVDAGTLSAVEDTGEPATPELLAHVRERLRQHGPAIAGRGGDKHTFQACAMVTRGYALRDAEAVALLSEWDATCVPPWGGELRTKMDNADNYASGARGELRSEWAFAERLRGLMAARSDAPTDTTAGTRASLNALLSPAAVSNGLVKVEAAVGTYAAALDDAANDVMAYLGATTGIENEKPLFRGKLFGMHERPTWLAKDLIVEGGIAVVATEPKSAKTWLATEIALAVASGTPVCNVFTAARRHVAYYYTEDMGRAIDNRVRSLCKGRGIEPSTVLEHFHHEPRGRSIDVSKDEECARIIASVRTLGDVGLIVLDPLRNIHTGKENEADSMSEVFRRIRMISVLCRCTVLIVHHAQKASETSKQRRPGQRMRGSGAIHGFVDSGIYLEDLRGDCVTVFTNTVRSEVKAARSAKPFELTLTIVDDANGEAVNARWATGDVGATVVTDEKVMTWKETAWEIVDAMLLAEVKLDPLKTARAIYKAVSGRNDGKAIAIKMAVQEGWIRADQSGKYTLTPTGQALGRERASNPEKPAPSPPSDHTKNVE